MEVAAAKAALRAELRRRRAALPAAQRRAADSAICQAAEGLIAERRPRVVLAYAAVGDEVDLSSLLTGIARAGRLVLPSVDGLDLRLHAVEDPTALVPGWRRVAEPPPDSPRVAPEAVDLALVPGLGFDARGGRLGQGGGHFDRLLARVRPDTMVAGVAYSVQLVPELPREPHDRPVDVVVTERGVLPAAAG